ncbi:MAG TPA: hypothetical protein VJB16_02435, partial [archaeon]|nr:hypothetical protein [archaeon]
MPHYGSLYRSVAHAREHGDFGCAAGDPRVAGAFGQVDIGLRGEPDVAALRGDLRKQELVKDRIGEVLVGQYGLGIARRQRYRPWHRLGDRR